METTKKLKKFISFVIVFALLVGYWTNIDSKKVYAAGESYFALEADSEEPVSKITVMKGYECRVYYVNDKFKSEPNRSYDCKWKSADNKIVKVIDYGGNSTTGYSWATLKLKGVGKTKLFYYNDQGKKEDSLTVIVKERISLKITSIKIKSESVSFKVTNKSKTAIKMTGCTKDNYHFEDEYESVEEKGTLSPSAVTIKGGETKTLKAKFKTDIESRDNLNFLVEKYGVKYVYQLNKFNIFRWYCSRSFLLDDWNQIKNWY